MIISYILRYKAILSKYKEIEITPCILSNHKVLISPLEPNNKNNSRKYTNNWRLYNTLFKYQWVIEEKREEMKFP
jgi:hypothetical protein